MIKALLKSFLFLFFNIGMIILIPITLIKVPDNYTFHIIVLEIAILIIIDLYYGLNLSNKIENIAKKEVRKQHLKPIDFGKYKDYFREIIKNNSPLTLSYIDNYEIDNSSIVATLLQLEHKEIITIENNKIKILKKDNLTNLENLIIKNIKDGILTISTKSIIKEVANNSQELLKENKNKGKKLKSTDIVIIFFPLLFLACILTTSKYIIIGTIIFLLLLFILPIIVGYKVDYELNELEYIRNKKGNEINIKLEGLKNYINDFSNLEEKEKKELKLWEDYLIYAVMFNINKKIIEEYENYFSLK